MRPQILAVLAFVLFTGSAATAADDPSIKGQLRQDIRASMESFIVHQTTDGALRHYDPVEGRLLVLEKPQLHDGIVKKGGFYVSCADFVDQDGRRIDVDFMVLETDGELRTTQAIVHKIDGEKRPYDLETE